MINTNKVQHSLTLLGNLYLDVYKTEDGTYYLSQTETASIVCKSMRSVQYFLKKQTEHEAPKRLIIDRHGTRGGAAFIKAIPLPLALSYWEAQAKRGNEIAIEVLADYKTNQ